MGTQNVFFVPRSRQDKKHPSVFLYRAQNLPPLLFYSHYSRACSQPIYPEKQLLSSHACFLTKTNYANYLQQLIKFSSVTFWPIRRFKKQKPVKEVEPFTCYWSKFKGYSVKVPSVLLLYVQTFRTESGCVSLSVSRKHSSSKQWPQKQMRSLTFSKMHQCCLIELTGLTFSKMHQCCLIELTGLGLNYNFFQ